MKIETLGTEGRSKFLPPRQLRFASKTSHLDLLREWCVEHLADSGLQSREGKRLLEQVDTFFQHAVVADDVLRVPGHVQHSRFGAKRGNTLRQLAPVHYWHDHVGQEQVNGAGVTVGGPNSGGAVRGFEHVIALILQCETRQAAELGFVLHNQNSFVSLPGFRRCNHRLSRERCYGRVDARQINLECRSLARLAVDPNGAFTLLNDSIDGREAEAGALGRLGSE